MKKRKKQWIPLIVTMMFLIPLWNGIGFSYAKEDEKLYESKYLLVESEKEDFDTCGAKDVIWLDGMYMLSYPTEEKTEQAYYELLNQEGISRVEIDTVREIDAIDQNNGTVITEKALNWKNMTDTKLRESIEYSYPQEIGEFLSDLSNGDKELFLSRDLGMYDPITIYTQVGDSQEVAVREILFYQYCLEAYRKMLFSNFSKAKGFTGYSNGHCFLGMSGDEKTSKIGIYIELKNDFSLTTGDLNMAEVKLGSGYAGRKIESVSIKVPSGSKNNHNISISKWCDRFICSRTKGFTLFTCELNYTKSPYYQGKTGTLSNIYSNGFTYSFIDHRGNFSSKGKSGHSSSFTGGYIYSDLNRVYEAKVGTDSANYGGEQKTATSQKLYIRCNSANMGLYKDDSLGLGRKYSTLNLDFYKENYGVNVKAGTGIKTVTSDGTTNTNSVAKTKSAGSKINISAVAKDGYRFSKWQYNGTSSLSNLTSGVTSNGNEVLFHKENKTYTASGLENTGTIKYNTNGGKVKTGLSPATTRIIKYADGDINLPNVAYWYEREGYHIENGKKAWMDTSSLTSGTVFYNEDPDGSTDKNLKALVEVKTKHGIEKNIYVNWTLNTYEVVYNKNAEDTTGKMATSTYMYNETKKLSQNLYEHPLYEFTGWNTKKNGTGTTYGDGEKVKNLSSKNGDVINLYAQWEKKRFNVGYSGNKQSAGTNMLEYNIWHGDDYIFRNNVFEKEEMEVRQTESGEKYEVNQRYGFLGWGFVSRKDNNIMMIPKENQPASEFYKLANASGGISDTVSDSIPYEDVKPLGIDLASTASGDTPAKEYINLRAVWDAYPVIIIEPTLDQEDEEDEKFRIEDNILFFYEGEEPTKESLIAHLSVTDKEDGNLKSNVKIKKIVYNDGRLKAGYTETWEDDLPKDYVFDTYYLKMEKDEVITHKVTYEVTDSVGNTTTEILPVKVKYNHYPEIKAEGDDYTFYYLKEESNMALITEEELLERLWAEDKEDGEKIKDKVTLVGFNPQLLMMQTTAIAEFEIDIEVTDRFHKTTDNTISVQVVDPDALEAEIPKRYTRFISLKHMNTLAPNSKWRESENVAYLKSVLENETQIDTWKFPHEDVVKIKTWILEDGDGHWKMGREANREFYEMYGYCRTR